MLTCQEKHVGTKVTESMTLRKAIVQPTRAKPKTVTIIRHQHHPTEGSYRSDSPFSLGSDLSSCLRNKANQSQVE